MNKKIYLIISILLLVGNLFGQISDIQKKADEKNHSKSDDKKVSSNNSSSTTSGDPCTETCIEAFCTVTVDLLFEALRNHHHYVMELDDPTNLSFSVIPTVAYGFHLAEGGRVYDYINILPQIRGRWGVLSTDFRFNYLVDFENFNSDYYKTWDWSILQLNIQPAEEFRFTLGSGILAESYTNKYYHSSYAGIEICNLNRRISTELNARYATDYQNGGMFTEVNFAGGYMFYRTDNLFTYFNLGVIYQNYYQTHDIMLFRVGLTFNIH